MKYFRWRWRSMGASYDYGQFRVWAGQFSLMRCWKPKMPPKPIGSRYVAKERLEEILYDDRMSTLDMAGMVAATARSYRGAY